MKGSKVPSPRRRLSSSLKDRSSTFLEVRVSGDFPPSAKGSVGPGPRQPRGRGGGGAPSGPMAACRRRARGAGLTDASGERLTNAAYGAPGHRYLRRRQLPTGNRGPTPSGKLTRRVWAGLPRPTTTNRTSGTPSGSSRGGTAGGPHCSACRRSR